MREDTKKETGRNRPCFALAAGGTGGHIFPALALHDLMVKEGAKVLFLTDRRGKIFMENLPPEKVPDTLIEVSSGGLVTGSLFKRLSSFFKLVRGYFSSRHILSVHQPAVLVGFGGYPAAPPLLAAQGQGIPTLLHEQNSVMGKANQLMARKATKICLSFEQTYGLKGLDLSRIKVVGNPVRSDIEALGHAPFQLPLCFSLPSLQKQGPSSQPLSSSQKFNLLVLGGSLGAQFLSEIVPQALELLPEAHRARLHIVQQARSENIGKLKKIYTEMGLSHEIFPFIETMAKALKNAHLLLCRAGATSVAEIAAARRPAIFIPLDIHSDQHQVRNASSLSDERAAWILPQSLASPQELSQQITTLLDNPEQLKITADRAFSFAGLSAARKLYDLTLATVAQDQKLTNDTQFEKSGK